MTIAQIKTDIEAYIKKCEYTWTFEEVYSQYRGSLDGEYVSSTMRDIIKTFKTKLEFIYTTLKFDVLS